MTCNDVFRYALDLCLDGVEAGVVADAAAAGQVVLPVQTHSCNVAVIGSDGVVPPLDDTDAVICLSRGMAIGVRTADCVPVVLAAPDIGAVAAVHAGWKGSLGGIVTATVERLGELGADPTLIHAAFGPSICGHCYEVSAELAMQFADGGFAEAVNGRHVDLQMVNRLRLLQAGIAPENIVISQVCTLETPRLPSWRRCATDKRLVTFIKRL